MVLSLLISILFMKELVLFYEVSGAAVESSRCYTCINARSNEECNRSGFTICRKGEICQNEIRVSTAWKLITKRCKQRTACQNNYIQNLQVAWRPSQCNPSFGKNSVCRCCCTGDLCNNRELPCLNETDCSYLSSPPRARKFCSNGQQPGSVCSFSCAFGYRRLGTARRRCNGLTGKWSASSPTCQLVTCRSQRNPENGFVTCTESNRFRSECSFRCNQNYTVRGSDAIRCRVNGQWSESTPTCEPITCPENIELPVGAQMDAPSFYAISSRITFSCDGGYYVRGNPTITCIDRNDDGIGEWDQPPPECGPITCSSPEPPTNGKFRISFQTTYGSLLSVDCEEGYFMVGDDHLQCLDINDDGEGEWSPTMPTCRLINCPLLNTPPNGSFVSPPQTRYGTVLSVRCDQGYFLIGANAVRCEDINEDGIGSWNASLPDCILISCPMIPFPENGYFQLPFETRYGSVLTIGCNKGFYLNGTENLECIDSNTDGVGDWNNEIATCEVITCPFLNSPEDGRITNSSNRGYGSVVTFECNEGFFLFGQKSLQCRDVDNDGVGDWSNNSPSCRQITCPTPDTPINGNYQLPIRLEYGSILSAVCNEGYYLFSETTIRCEDKNNDGIGSWNNTVPECSLIYCPILEPPQNGTFEDPVDTGYGSNASIICNVGFFPSGQTTLRCVDADNNGIGEWNNTTPTCRPITCPIQNPPVNGTFRSVPETGFGSVLTVECYEGYFVFGENDIKCLDLNNDGNGDWNAPLSSCEPIVCSRLSPPLNGRFQRSLSRLYGAVVTVLCDTGFYLLGESELRCSDRNQDGLGEWSRSLPFCRPIFCPSLTPPINGRFQNPLQTSFGYRLEVECNTGYFLIGNTALQCGDSDENGVGDWTSRIPVCQRITCDPLPVPENANLSPQLIQFEYGDEIIVTCSDRYFLTGSSTLRCVDDDNNGEGEWNNDLPVCQLIRCPILSPPSNGRFLSLDSPRMESVLRVVCNEGFFTRGNDVIECIDANNNGTGTWNATLPSCERILCPFSLPVPANGMVVYPPVSGLGSKASYFCDEGYFLNGSSEALCEDPTRSVNGEWSGDAPECKLIQCPALAPPPFGEFLFSNPTLGVGTQLFVVCQRGYYPLFREIVTCTSRNNSATGTWEGTLPSCNLISCPPLPAPPNGFLDYSEPDLREGTIVTVVCDEGFRDTGSPRTQTCLSDGIRPLGQWSGNLATCSRIICSTPLSIPENGNITCNDSNYLSSECHYSCAEGYYLVGNDITTCSLDNVGGKNASWSAEPAICQKITCLRQPAPNHGARSCSDGESYGSTCWFECEQGYSLIGRDAVVCDQSQFSEGVGRWTEEIPFCQSNQCNPPSSDPINGSHSCINENLYQSLCEYACAEGYKLIGSPTRVCQADETWSAAEPQCELIQCPPTPNVQNAIVDCTNGNFFGSSCTFFCELGYRFFGNRTLRCLADKDGDGFGDYNSAPPQCQAVYCPEINTDVENGRIDCEGGIEDTKNNIFGSTCVLVCNEGWAADGASRATCNSMGQWSETLGLCRRYSCIPPLLVPVYGIKTCTSYDDIIGTVCNFRCESGTQLKGPSSVTCLEDGSWNNFSPTCTRTRIIV